MRKLGVGVGMSIGAGLGPILGLLMLDDWWLGLVVGVGVGLLVGAVFDLQAGSRRDND
jgi:hypothetical protein